MNKIMSTVTYVGKLRTESLHKRSGQTVISDAPIDNRGEGQAFSPTDTVANALATCMLTVMGIYAMDHNIDIDDTTAEVEKIMASDPRRISEINIDIHFPENDYSDKTKKILRKKAIHCPVHYCLHPEIVSETSFHF